MEQPTNGLAVMDAWIAQASEDELAAWGLFPGDDATYAAELQGSDAYTLENIVVSGFACVDTTTGAATLVAASAIFFAAALLN